MADFNTGTAGIPLAPVASALNGEVLAFKAAKVTDLTQELSMLSMILASMDTGKDAESMAQADEAAAEAKESELTGGGG